MTECASAPQTPPVITDVIIHLHNDMPVLVDLETLPAGSDRVVHCTNVRTLDGKRPSFVHDRHSTFIIPLSVIRLIEAPAAKAAGSADEPGDAATPAAGQDEESRAAQAAAEQLDEEPDEDLLARIRDA